MAPRWALRGAFVLALALTMFFGGRAVWHAVYWSDPARIDQPVAGWMTPGYVARSWHVPPDVIASALDLPPPSERTARPPPLAELARQRGVPVEELITGLQSAIAAHRARQP